MTYPILVRASVADGVTTVESLVKHPMDSGFVKDKAGKLIPPHYIEVIDFTHEGKLVMRAFWGPAISQNPFSKFSFKGGKSGDTIGIAWVDNKGERSSATAKIA